MGTRCTEDAILCWISTRIVLLFVAEVVVVSRLVKSIVDDDVVGCSLRGSISIPEAVNKFLSNSCPDVPFLIAAARRFSPRPFIPLLFGSTFLLERKEIHRLGPYLKIRGYRHYGGVTEAYDTWPETFRSTHACNQIVLKNELYRDAIDSTSSFAICVMFRSLQIM